MSSLISQNLIIDNFLNFCSKNGEKRIQKQIQHE